MPAVLPHRQRYRRRSPPYQPPSAHRQQPQPRRAPYAQTSTPTARGSRGRCFKRRRCRTMHATSTLSAAPVARNPQNNMARHLGTVRATASWSSSRHSTQAHFATGIATRLQRCWTAGTSCRAPAGTCTPPQPRQGAPYLRLRARQLWQRLTRAHLETGPSLNHMALVRKTRAPDTGSHSPTR